MEVKENKFLGFDDTREEEDRKRIMEKGKLLTKEERERIRNIHSWDDLMELIKLEEKENKKRKK